MANMIPVPALTRFTYPNIEFFGGRVFIDPAYGCASDCGFCYISNRGRSDKIAVSRLPGGELAQLLLDHPQFIPGKEGTLISFSPHTESLDTKVFGKLLEFIKGLSCLGNPMQIATKRYVTPAMALKLANAVTYDKQLTVFISSSTITFHQIFESGTTHPMKRFEGFSSCASVGVPSCLYIKPLIPGVSLLDINLYMAIIEKYAVKHCCVGLLYGNYETLRAMNQKLQALGINNIGNSTGNLILPFQKELKQVQAIQELKRFCSLLMECGVEVHLTSNCVVAHILNIASPQSTWIRFPDLCTKCQDCANLSKMQLNNMNREILD